MAATLLTGLPERHFLWVHLPDMPTSASFGHFLNLVPAADLLVLYSPKGACIRGLPHTPDEPVPAYALLASILGLRSRGMDARSLMFPPHRDPAVTLTVRQSDHHLTLVTATKSAVPLPWFIRRVRRAMRKSRQTVQMNSRSVAMRILCRGGVALRHEKAILYSSAGMTDSSKRTGITPAKRPLPADVTSLALFAMHRTDIPSWALKNFRRIMLPVTMTERWGAYLILGGGPALVTRWCSLLVDPVQGPLLPDEAGKVISSVP